MGYRFTRKRERGATLVEFAIGATVFLTVLFAVVELGRLFWVHNALRDATRRGARYAAVRKNDAAGVLAVKKMVVYGDPNANPSTATPVVPGLTTANVYLNPNDQKSYKNWNGIQLSSRVSVHLTGYQFRFAVPLVGGTLNLPNYRNSMAGESAGFIPCDLASGTPTNAALAASMTPCPLIPN